MHHIIARVVSWRGPTFGDKRFLPVCTASCKYRKKMHAWKYYEFTVFATFFAKFKCEDIPSLTNNIVFCYDNTIHRVSISCRLMRIKLAEKSLHQMIQWVKLILMSIQIYVGVTIDVTKIILRIWDSHQTWRSDLHMFLLVFCGC